MNTVTKLTIVFVFSVFLLILIFTLLAKKDGNKAFLGIVEYKTDCGNNVCQGNENQQNCCVDCGCPSGQVCINKKCQSTTTSSNTTTPSAITTTISATGAPGAPSNPQEGLTPPVGTPSATTSIGITTTVIPVCSIYNCTGCENLTACINVGCTWCKVRNHCLRICQ